MAKTIEDVDFQIVHRGPGAGHTNEAVVHIRCPISELAALLALAGLTNSVPSSKTTPMIAVGDTGAR